MRNDSFLSVFVWRHFYLNFKVASPTNAKIVHNNPKSNNNCRLSPTFFFEMMMDWSHFKKILFPVNLKETTCIITKLSPKQTNLQTIAKTISCFTIIAITANEPPKSEPVSSRALCGRSVIPKAQASSLTDPQKIDNSPTSGIY